MFDSILYPGAFAAMIDIHREHLMQLSQAAQELPGRPAVSTVWRWTRGVRGVCLESVVIGGRRFTSREALQRFANELTRSAETEGIHHHRSNDGRAASRKLLSMDRELSELGL